MKEPDDKAEKLEKKLIDTNILQANSDMLIIFIGFAVILLGFLSAIIGIPKEMTIGASLAGLFFALSDLMVIGEKVSKFKIRFYIFSFMMGAISFVFVPAFLMVNQNFGELIIPFTDFFGLVALGVVLMSIGYRIQVAKEKQLNEIYSLIDDFLNEMKE
ncbi:hypothetical protein [Planococcus shenhongbingii]|uniref:Uncharacterized protein n=1 Tax=Planococcus shenhongbingii TaxID=3058398 RepID=A0ABT8N7W3_9BACL|nr:hypothetical protein [Planococcus sp. N017]MDN7243973.1 hypothetical protein [Planococcus sp. N017]